MFLHGVASFRGISTPSLTAQGEQRRSSFFNNDRDIPLAHPENITIIHAPNGFGKTVVLTLVNAFFSRQFITFFKYQFENLVLNFDDHKTVEIKKEAVRTFFPTDKDSSRESKDVRITFSSGSGLTGSFSPKIESTSPPLSRMLPFIERAGPDLWFDENTDEIISTRDALLRYSAQLPAGIGNTSEPEWLTEIINSIDCRLIETQRLLRIAYPEEMRRPSPRRTQTLHKSVVEMEALDLAKKIAVTLADYANQSQSLDQSFPKRVIAAFQSGQAPLADDVNRRLARLIHPTAARL